jgi:hypothetical protein
MYDLARRAAETQKVVDRFRSRPFDWGKRATCIHLARAQMRALGHRPPAVPDFRSARGALTALNKTGHESLEQLLDAMLPRIAPLSMIVGDLALVPGEVPFDALAISAGGTLLMYHQDANGLANVKDALLNVKAAWRL